jgi:hypothetical protein
MFALIEPHLHSSNVAEVIPCTPCHDSIAVPSCADAILSVNHQLSRNADLNAIVGVTWRFQRHNSTIPTTTTCGRYSFCSNQNTCLPHDHSYKLWAERSGRCGIVDSGNARHRTPRVPIRLLLMITSSYPAGSQRTVVDWLIAPQTQTHAAPRVSPVVANCLPVFVHHAELGVK